MQPVNREQLDQLETDIREWMRSVQESGTAILARIDQIRRVPRPPMTGPEVQAMLNLKPTKYQEMVRARKLRPIAGMNYGKGSVQYFPTHVIEALRDGREVVWPPGCPGADEADE